MDKKKGGRREEEEEKGKKEGGGGGGFTFTFRQTRRERLHRMRDMAWLDYSSVCVEWSSALPEYTARRGEGAQFMGRRVHILYNVFSWWYSKAPVFSEMFGLVEGIFSHLIMGAPFETVGDDQWVRS